MAPFPAAKDVLLPASVVGFGEPLEYLSGVVVRHSDRGTLQTGGDQVAGVVWHEEVEDCVRFEWMRGPAGGVDAQSWLLEETPS